MSEYSFLEDLEEPYILEINNLDSSEKEDIIDYFDNIKGRSFKSYTEAQNFLRIGEVSDYAGDWGWGSNLRMTNYPQSVD